ncbi:hypothetical protein [Aestuariibaculum suncheonense]|uniref:Uncharacterized protein n=1 Tax=Aestuariibaculum suncheonense TaxID=1028745 RepID=A0A8J6UMI2_9FLAO|nr:hypothetical protein [Aestuariibaculum suncheonense]MBD0836956.1 hypothetical protein [Aestuariibaculum suncheonense]
MKYFSVIIILGFTILIGCRQKKINIYHPIEKVTFENKASYYYEGINKLVIDNPEDINFIVNYLKSLRFNDRYNNITTNINYGYVTVFCLGKGKEERESLFTLIFSESYGQVIRYNGKKYPDKDQILSNFVKTKLGMRETKKHYR